MAAYGKSKEQLPQTLNTRIKCLFNPFVLSMADECFKTIKGIFDGYRQDMASDIGPLFHRVRISLSRCPAGKLSLAVGVTTAGHHCRFIVMLCAR